LKSQKGINLEELELYKKMVLSGQLYDALVLDFNKKYQKIWIRDQMKNMVFKIFYSKTSSYLKYKNFFASWFPTIMEFINNTNANSNKILAVKMQTLESHAVLDVIMPDLEKLGIKPYTIHDSFMCKQSQVDTIVSVVTQKMEELFGVCPTLKVEEVNTQVQEDEEVWEMTDDYFDYDDEEENVDLQVEPIQIKIPQMSMAEKQKILSALLRPNQDEEYGF
jgi:hypothetical protein